MSYYFMRYCRVSDYRFLVFSRRVQKRRQSTCASVKPNHELHELPHLPECSSSSLIRCYVDHGEWQHALSFYDEMLLEGCPPPDKYAFVALLKACIALGNVETGTKLHAEISRMGLLETDAFVGSALVDMYVKCASIRKAHEVFSTLQYQNVVTWTALISGYVEHEESGEVLRCIEQMRSQGISPDAHVYVCALKACGDTRSSDKGQELHADIVKKGLLERNIFVGSALVDMYAKCSFLAEAQEVFKGLEIRNAVHWTALLFGYAEHGYVEDALSCFRHMQDEGISPNIVTFVCCLKCCNCVDDVQNCHFLHLDIVKKGLESEPIIANTLVDSYAKCGRLVSARLIFDKFSVNDVVMWNAIIRGHLEFGNGEEAVYVSEQMHQKGVSPNAATYVCVLKACAIVGLTCKGQEIHANVIRKGLELDLLDNSILVDMYAKCGMLTDACEVLDKLRMRTVVVWNALAAEYVAQGRGQEALNCIEQMGSEGISPDASMLICSLKACTIMQYIFKGLEIHNEILKKGMEGELSIGNTLLDMYGKCGLLSEMQAVFNKLLIPDVVSWTAIVVGYVENDQCEETFYWFDTMESKGISPNHVTFLCLLKACGSVGSTCKGQTIHLQIAKKGLETQLLVGNILVDMYAKCGLIFEAQHTYDSLPGHDVVSNNSLTSAYGQTGEVQKILSLFCKLENHNAKVDTTTFASVLNACSHAGLVTEGQMYFEVFSSYCTVPTLEHYTCLANLLSRAGCVQKAVEIIERMPCHPDIVVWRTVLGACRKFSNVELGRYTFCHGIELDDKNQEVYVCMSNIYVDAAMINDAEKVLAMRSNKITHREGKSV